MDSGGKPLSGVGFHIWLVHKEGRRSEINLSSRILIETTGPDGIASVRLAAAFERLAPVLAGGRGLRSIVASRSKMVKRDQ